MISTRQLAGAAWTLCTQGQSKGIDCSRDERQERGAVVPALERRESLPAGTLEDDVRLGTSALDCDPRVAPGIQPQAERAGVPREQLTLDRPTDFESLVGELGRGGRKCPRLGVSGRRLAAARLEDRQPRCPEHQERDGEQGQAAHGP